MNKTCVRWLVLFLNILFIFLGFGLMALALWIFLEHGLQELRQSLGTQTQIDSVLYAVMAIGMLTVLVAFCSCCALLRRRRSLLGFCFACLMLVLVSQLAIIVLSVYYRPLVHSRVRVRLDSGVKKSSIATWISQLQEHLTCCGGSKGVQDYLGRRLPVSCCQNQL